MEIEVFNVTFFFFFTFYIDVAYCYEIDIVYFSHFT